MLQHINKIYRPSIFFCLSRCEVLVALSEILSKICQTEGKYTALCDLTHKYGNIN